MKNYNIIGCPAQTQFKLEHIELLKSIEETLKLQYKIIKYEKSLHKKYFQEFDYVM